VTRFLAPILAFATLLGASTALAQDGSAEGGGPSGPFDIRVIGAVAELNSHRAQGAEERRARTREGCVRRGARTGRCVRVIDAEAIEMYDSLLPEPIEPAKHRRVGFWLAELAAGGYAHAGAPWTDTHWIEGAIELRVVFTHADGRREQGWYPVHYPVSSEFWFQLGRAVGLPKLHSTVTSAESAGGWTMTATPPGADSPSMTLPFRAADAEVDPELAELADGAALEPFFVLSPAFEGPTLNRVLYAVGPPPEPFGSLPGGPPKYDPAQPPQTGLVDLAIDPDIDAHREDLRRLLPEGETLATMIEPRQTVPGIYRFNRLGLGSETTEVGDGGYGT
jgi:hypothetical protein